MSIKAFFTTKRGAITARQVFVGKVSPLLFPGPPLGSVCLFGLGFDTNRYLIICVGPDWAFKMMVHIWATSYAHQAH